MQHRAVGTGLLLVLLPVKELIYSSCSLLWLLEGLVTAAIKLSSCAKEACLLVVQWWWNIIAIRKKEWKRRYKNGVMCKLADFLALPSCWCFCKCYKMVIQMQFV